MVSSWNWSSGKCFLPVLSLMSRLILRWGDLGGWYRGKNNLGHQRSWLNHWAYEDPVQTPIKPTGRPTWLSYASVTRISGEEVHYMRHLVLDRWRLYFLDESRKWSLENLYTFLWTECSRKKKYTTVSLRTPTKYPFSSRLKRISICIWMEHKKPPFIDTITQKWHVTVVPEGHRQHLALLFFTEFPKDFETANIKWQCAGFLATTT